MTGQSKLIMMMSDKDIVDKRYENGKIYTIKHPEDDKVYVGSTIKSLKHRFYRHKEGINCSLYKYVNGNFDGWEIKLYEDYPCKNKYELQKREGDIIRQLETINKQIAGRTKKEYHEDNRDNILEQKKVYYEANKDKLAEQKKQNYENNKDKLVEQSKQYRQANKEKIAERRKQKVICDRCGCESTKLHIARHKRTLKCINFNPT